jgi:hypothetical protein
MRRVNITERIDECARQAETAPNLQARVAWKQMEDFWRARARSPAPTKTFAYLDEIKNAKTENRQRA